MTKFAVPFLSGIAVCVAMMGSAAQAQFIKLGQPMAWQEAGQASWYGGRHNGRRTSSGEIFNQNAMTAAHAYLPLGSRVRVTMAGSGSSVVVTITDRQPDHGRRIIDLSRGAAARIGLLGQGTGMVTLASVSAAEAASEPVEVAEAPDDAGVSPRPRGQQRTRPGGPTVGGGPSVESTTVCNSSSAFSSAPSSTA